MSQGLAVILPQLFFFILDLIIFSHTRRNRTGTKSEKIFCWFEISVLLQQGLTVVSYAEEYGMIRVFNWLQFFYTAIAITAMTASSYCWFRYLRLMISERRENSVALQFLMILPVLLIFTASAVSPWTHWVFWIDAAGEYCQGKLYILQILCPYVYMLLALMMTVHQLAVGEFRRISRMIRNFIIFLIPSMVGVCIQMLVFRGGYSQIGISFGLILMYLEQYMDEVNENRRLKSVEELNRELQRLNEEQEARLQEITALNKELEEARYAADAANHAKTIFLNNMSHDIRTPMNAILGFARLMEKRTDQPEVITNYLGKIEQSGEYLLSVINNVLDMARIESGQTDLVESVMDVGDDDACILQMFDSDIAKKRLRFTHEIHVEHRYVMADEAKMTQILVNLLSNAVKYTPEGGSIHLSERELPCGREGFAAYEVTVSDTGIGMSREFLNHIFDFFAREHTTTESKVIGSGLGMSIVKKLVDLMGGRIEVESELGKGSTFRVLLTLAIAEDPHQAENADSSEAAAAGLKGRHILLAEDNDLNAEIAGAILEEYGIRMDRAEDGDICVDMLAEASAGTYDAVLMDIQMPRKNGYEAARAIRALEDPAKAKIPIIAMTANAFEEDRKKALDAGMNDHLAKPIDVAKLTAVLSEILRGC